VSAGGRCNHHQRRRGRRGEPSFLIIREEILLFLFQDGFCRTMLEKRKRKRVEKLAYMCRVGKGINFLCQRGNAILGCKKTEKERKKRVFFLTSFGEREGKRPRSKIFSKMGGTHFLGKKTQLPGEGERFSESSSPKERREVRIAAGIQGRGGKKSEQ